MTKSLTVNLDETRAPWRSSQALIEKSSTVQYINLCSFKADRTNVYSVNYYSLPINYNLLQINVLRGNVLCLA